MIRLVCGATVAEHQGDPGSIPGRFSPDFRMWESSTGFLGDLPFPPSFLSGAAPYSYQSPSSALKTSMFRAVQISSLTCLHLRFGRLSAVREIEVNMERRRNSGAGETGDPRRPAASSATIPTCENRGAAPTGIEPGSPRWEASSLATTPPRLPVPSGLFIPATLSYWEYGELPDVDEVRLARVQADCQCDRRTKDLPPRGWGSSPRSLDYKSATLSLSFGDRTTTTYALSGIIVWLFTRYFHNERRRTLASEASPATAERSDEVVKAIASISAGTKERGKREIPEKTRRPTALSDTIITFENPEIRKHVGATVAEQLACSPPTKTIQVQSPAGSLRIFACGNRAGRCRWSASFLGDLPFPPPFHSGAAPYSPLSPSSALKISTLRAVQISSLAHAQLHHRGSKLDPRSDLRLTQQTVGPFEFRAGREIEMKFISNPRNWRFEISIRDQQPSSTIEKYAYFHDVMYYEPIAKFVSYLMLISHFGAKIDESEIQNHEISLEQHIYIGTKIKLDPGSELGSFRSGKMLVQPDITHSEHVIYEVIFQRRRRERASDADSPHTSHGVSDLGRGGGEGRGEWRACPERTGLSEAPVPAAVPTCTPASATAALSHGVPFSACHLPIPQSTSSRVSTPTRNTRDLQNSRFISVTCPLPREHILWIYRPLHSNRRHTRKTVCESLTNRWDHWSLSFAVCSADQKLPTHAKCAQSCTLGLNGSREIGQFIAELAILAEEFSEASKIRTLGSLLRGLKGLGATVAERLACSPPTKAIRVQSPAVSLRIFLVGRRVFSGIPRSPSPLIPALLHTHLNHAHRRSRPRRGGISGKWNFSRASDEVTVNELYVLSVILETSVSEAGLQVAREADSGSCQRDREERERERERRGRKDPPTAQVPPPASLSRAKKRRPSRQPLIKNPAEKRRNPRCSPSLALLLFFFSRRP
ncbi:hypothetical protein PR048_023745 [Dryococelus australis]|uniref:Uncharacterized protein n=1 Tax=Dryococelus australis TaxID=614101 RepID=A0ABQ9GV15_9NEOP|nr:hypothetical protein PR048_023745 [Dryococelus australis]